MTRSDFKLLRFQSFKGCFIIRDSNDPQYLFTLQQTLHFVGPCATRIAFVNGLFRFDQVRDG